MRFVLPPSLDLQHYGPNAMALDTWLQMFEAYCHAAYVQEEPAPVNGVIPDNRRRALFITALGPRALELVRCAALPLMPRQKSINQMVAILRERYEPDGLVTSHRYTFHNRCQKENESAFDYVAALQELAVKCDFGLHYFEALCDRLVTGIRNDHVRRKLLSEPRLTFLRAKEIVMQQEAVTRQARVIAQNVNLVQRRPPNQGSNNSQRGRYRGPNQQGTRPVKHQQQQQQQQQKKPEGCYRCLRNHDPKSCPARFYSCNSCKKQGHYSKACRNKKTANVVNNQSNPSSSGPSTSSGAGASVYHLDSLDDEVRRVLNCELQDEEVRTVF